MSKRSMLIGISAITLAAVSGANASIYNVGPGQTYSTIQGAVNAAASADIAGATDNTPPASPVDIVIQGGTYNESVSIPADSSNKFNSQNDDWTIEAAPNNTVWVNGSVSIGSDRDNGFIRGINLNESSTGTWGYYFSAGTARNWTVSDGIVYAGGTNPNGAIYGVNMYGSDSFDHMTIVGTGYGADSEYASSYLIHNSIFANITNTAVVGGGDGINVDHSIFHTNGTDFSASVTDAGSNQFATDPSFASTDPNSPDFLKLLPGSPAVGAASDPGLYADGSIGALGVVPEPASLSVLGGAFALIMARRRRQ